MSAGRRIGLGLLLGGLSACASIGPAFDTTHVAEIRRGAQDRAQIRAWLGEPHQVTEPQPGESTDCVELWHYARADAEPGGTTASDVLVVGFDADDRVCSVGYWHTR